MTADLPHLWRGGCLCGAVRYEVTAIPRKTSLCHCEDCRRASGAPVVAWTFFPSGSLSFVHGDPCLLRHAERERTFCRDCGTPLTFFDPAIPSEFEVTTCSLDEGRVAPPPEDHNWTSDMLPWLRVNEDLLAYEQNTPPQP
jgi:hypothetical protein